MADTPAPVTPPDPSTSPVIRRMSPVMVGAAGATGGAGSGVVIAFLWNWWAVREWQAPQMDIGTAGAVAIMMAPVFGGIAVVIHYIACLFPMPKVRERRA